MSEKQKVEAAEPPVSKTSDPCPVCHEDCCASETTIVPCLVCGKWLDRVSEDAPMQPYGGVMCRTAGNYGSRVLDEVFADALVLFIVCDECLTANSRRVRRAVSERIKPTTTYTEWPVFDTADPQGSAPTSAVPVGGDRPHE